MRGGYVVAGRWLLAAVLLLSSISKLNQLNDSIWTLTEIGVPYAEIIAPGLAIAELVLAYCIAVGLQRHLAIPVLVLFCLLNMTVYRDLLLQDENLLAAQAEMSSLLAQTARAVRTASFLNP